MQDLFSPHPSSAPRSADPRLFDNLNPEQLKAVTLGRQSALVLAGAGSGKTRVLTTRIAYLIQTGQVSPSGLLAVTFTNKAAREMLTRLSAMMPINTRGMWVGTFHGLCNRMLRAHYRDANLPQTFQILDSGDQQSAIKRLLKTLNIDDEKFKPRELGWFINNAKEQGLRADSVEANDDFTRQQIELYRAYDVQCNREGVVDFAELLLRCYELLSRNAPLLEHYAARFKFILVDEFQDTNRLQYKWIKLLAGKDNAVFGVGDDDQCLVAGTKVTMADGSTKAIEAVRTGEAVLSCFGAKRFKSATVQKTHRRTRSTVVVSITLASGTVLKSTPEHTHFAGYLLGETPQTYFTYLMYKRTIGYRLGTSQVHARGQVKPAVGFKQRAVQEHADALWVVSTHNSENAARADEIILSLRYGLPTLPFVPRNGKAVNGLVHDAAWIKRVFAEIDTEKAAKKLLGDVGLDHDEPHHAPRSRNSNRRNINITLCGDGRSASSQHRITVMGNDVDGRRTLEKLGLSVREAKKKSASWRYETSGADFAAVHATAKCIQKVLGGQIKLRAGIHSTPLPFVRAQHVRAGMAMVGRDGALDFVVDIAIDRARTRTVYDLDIAGTHNFIANGIVTHNSIYAFRGAEAANMRDFQRDFAGNNLIKLEQNYRSHGAILDAANAIISRNKDRLGKNLWTESGKGEALRVYAAASDNDEAEFVIDEVKALNREGMALADMALLYRSNAQSRVLEHALFRAGIGYRVYGGLRFFERLEVKHAMAYLRLAGNPDDDGAFSRVVNFPPRGIGARSIEQVQALAQRDNMSMYAAAASGVAKGEIAGRAASAVGAFLKIVEGLKASTSAINLPELVDEALERSGMRAHYAAEREGADRLENLAELVTACTQFEEAFEATEEIDTPLVGFLTHASLEAGEHEAGAADDALQLMTVHSAKGLEFHAVFLSGLEEGLFPHENSLNSLDGVEEERRLMYVAVTRARQRLYLSYAGSRMLHGQIRYGMPSRFVDEIPPELCKMIVVPEKQAAYGGYSTGRQTSIFDSPSNRSGGGGTYTGFKQSYTPAADDKAASYGREGAPDTSRAGFETKRDALPFSIGQNVTHAKFGEGVVVDIEGRGADARVQVKFRGEGTKWLALQYAKLVAA